MENLPALIGTLFMLILLQAVLGFDNLLYISLESKRAPEKDQSRVRKLGIGIAMAEKVIAERSPAAFLHQIEPARLDPGGLCRRGPAVEKDDGDGRFTVPDAHEPPP